MHFIPCNINEVRRERNNSDIRKLLMKIVDSGEACVEIKDYGHVNAQSCANALRNRIKIDRLKQLQVVTKDKHVYVINTLQIKGVN